MIQKARANKVKKNGEEAEEIEASKGEKK